MFPASGRGFRVALVVVLVILGILVTSVAAGAVVLSKYTERAQLQTLEYVGELTAEKVRHFAHSGQHTLESTVDQIEAADHGTPDVFTQVGRTLYSQLSQTPELQSITIAWRDGSYYKVSRIPDSTKYSVTHHWGDEGTVAYHATYNQFWSLVSSKRFVSSYDVLDEEWYRIASYHTPVVWQEPEISTDLESTVVVASQAARDDLRNILAVVSVEVDTSQLSEALDEVPYGEGAEAYVVANGGAIVATQTDSSYDLDQWIADNSAVACTSDLGITIADTALESGETRATISPAGVVLDVGVDESTGLPWQIHIEASHKAVSDGLDSVQKTLVWLAIGTVVAGSVAGLLLWFMRGPLVRLQNAASTDPLTGLPNRRKLDELAKPMLALAHTRGAVVAGGVLDLDNFKLLNDECGHDSGDAALVAVGKALQEGTRATDVVARLGGDEFAFLLAVDSPEQAVASAQRLRERLVESMHRDVPGSSMVGVTIGLSVDTAGTDSVEDLLLAADEILVAGKAQCKGCVHGPVAPAVS